MLFLFSFMQMLLSILAFERGDRISTALQTLHGGWRTPFIDIAIHQMPKFQTPDSTIMSVSLPHKGENEPEMKLDPTDNVYVSISFAHNKLLLPRLVLFDASTKRSMETVTITFSHDDFDVLRISHHVTCKLLPCVQFVQHPMGVENLTFLSMISRFSTLKKI